MSQLLQLTWCNMHACAPVMESGVCFLSDCTDAAASGVVAGCSLLVDTRLVLVGLAGVPTWV